VSGDPAGAAGTATGRAGFWILLAVAWFATMGWRPLLEPDEGRYAEIPREMHVSGDWVTPRLDNVKYFEKPPLQYWATAAMYSVFGVSEWTARFWSCALAFLCLPLAYAFARHLYGTSAAGVGAATVLAVNPYFAIIGQINLLDSALAFFLTGSMFAFLRARAAPAGSVEERRWMCITSVALGLAVLSKGVVALVLSGGTLVLHMAITREIRPLRRWHLPITVPLFLAVTLPWFLTVSSRNPEFAGFFFIHEHFARYLTNVSDRVQPWWFFLPIVLLAALPWLGVAVSAGKALWQADRRDPQASVRWFLWIWCALTLLFFSISHSKLPPYVLPLMPALAVLFAPHVAERPKRTPYAAWTTCGLVVLIGVSLAVIASRKAAPALASLSIWAAVAIAIAVLGAGFSRRSWLVPAAASILAFQLLIVSYSLLPPLRTAKPLVAAVRQAVGPGTALYSVNQYRQSIPPYLGRTLRIALYRGELDFGLTQESGRFIRTLEEFVSEWQLQKDAIAFIEPSMIPMLRERAVPMRVLARDERTIAVARH
jgi:4-amino-4-deoxy-L-arabinose transferase-like glycosyltransferase